MSALINLSLRVDKLPKQNFIAGKDGRVYCNVTVSVNDDSNQYGQNVKCFVPQSQEEREAKKPKEYLGDGKVFWNNGQITNAVKQENQQATVQESSSSQTEVADLPF